MTSERKILYVLGAIIIVSMIAVGSFSLGVYVGKQGWILNEPSVFGPRQGPNQGPDGVQEPPQNRDDNLPPKPDLIGRVINISPSSLEVDTADGIRLILISDETVVSRQGEGNVETAHLSDIKIGVHIAVIGEFSDDGRTLTGEIIILLKPKQ